MSEESKELDGNVSTAELLGEVKTAIRKILIGGQSYQIGSRKLTRADLYQLRKLKASSARRSVSCATWHPVP